MHGPWTVRTTRAILAGCLVAALLAGCEGIVPATPIGGLATPGIPAELPSIAPGAIRFTCGRIPFDPAILAERRTDETGRHARRRRPPQAPRARRDGRRLAPGRGLDAGRPGRAGRGVRCPRRGGARLRRRVRRTLIGEPQASFAVGGLAVDGWGGCTPTRVLPAGLGDAGLGARAGRGRRAATTGVRRPGHRAGLRQRPVVRGAHRGPRRGRHRRDRHHHLRRPRPARRPDVSGQPGHQGHGRPCRSRSATAASSTGPRSRPSPGPELVRAVGGEWTGDDASAYEPSPPIVTSNGGRTTPCSGTTDDCRTAGSHR